MSDVDIVLRLDEFKSYSSTEAKLFTEAKLEILELRSQVRLLREIHDRVSGKIDLIAAALSDVLISVKE